MPTKLPRCRVAGSPATSDIVVGVAVDRPKGHTRRYRDGDREVVETFPTDHGRLRGLINPEDGEEIDVFVGSGGAHCGRFRKGDEHMWFLDCTPAEVSSLTTFWGDIHAVRDLLNIDFMGPYRAQLAFVLGDALVKVGAYRTTATDRP